MSDLPPRPPPGHTRYKAYARDPLDNPFRGRNGLNQIVQTVDVTSDTPRSQVEEWAREAAEQKGYTFLRLETPPCR